MTTTITPERPQRTESQSFMIAFLLTMMAKIATVQNVVMETVELPNRDTDLPSDTEYRTPRLTLRFVDGPKHFFVGDVGYPWNDVKTLKQQLYQQWYYWADCGQPFDYGAEEEQVIQVLGMAKRYLTELMPKVTMQRRSDHFLTIMLWPIVDGGELFRAELIFQ